MVAKTIHIQIKNVSEENNESFFHPNYLTRKVKPSPSDRIVKNTFEYALQKENYTLNFIWFQSIYYYTLVKISFGKYFNIIFLVNIMIRFYLNACKIVR